MHPADISNGFASRWLFVPGEGGDPIPYPPPVDEVQAHRHYARLLQIIDRYESHYRGTTLQLSPDAIERWEEWYMADRRYVPETDDEASMRSRLGVHIQKIALTYAIGDGEREHIQLHHLEQGIAFVEWSWMHTRQMMKEWGVLPMNAIEVRIESALRRHRSLRRRELQRITASRKWGAADFAKILRAMIENGTVEVDAEGYHALAD